MLRFQYACLCGGEHTAPRRVGWNRILSDCHLDFDLGRFITLPKLKSEAVQVFMLEEVPEEEDRAEA